MLDVRASWRAPASLQSLVHARAHRVALPVLFSKNARLLEPTFPPVRANLAGASVAFCPPPSERRDVPSTRATSAPSRRG